MERVLRIALSLSPAVALLAGWSAAAQDGAALSNKTGYVLAVEDTIVVRVPDSEEYTGDMKFRIDQEGFVNLPLVGRRRAAGLTTRQLETELTDQLKSYYLSPRVSVSLGELRTLPISVLGAVNSPGLQQLSGSETLLEVISRAGGLRTEAGRTVTVVRQIKYGRLPIEEAKDDSSGQLSVAELKLASISSGERASANITMMPHDVVTVSRARMVYVLGEVPKTGGFVLDEKDEISALKVLAMAGGLSRNAAPGSARILRGDGSNGPRQEIAVNLSRIMKSKSDDVLLRPEDILFVPGNLTKKVANRTIEALIGVGSGVAIWRSSQ